MTSGPFGKGALSLNGGTLTSNAGGYTVANQLYLGVTGGSVTVGDTNNYALTLSGSAWLWQNMALTTPGSGVALTGAISDGGYGCGITKAGPGALTLSGASTYSGGTTLGAGELKIGANSATSGSGPVGTGTLSLNAGTISSDGSTTRNLYFNNVAIGGSMTFGDGTNTGGLNFDGAGGSITIATGNPTFTVNNTTYFGAGTGSGTVYDNGNGFTKAGNGTLVLGANRTLTTAFTGPITINAGTVQFGYSNNSVYFPAAASTVTVNSGGAATIATADALQSSTVILNGSGALNGSGGLGHLAVVAGLGGGSGTNVNLATWGPGGQYPFCFVAGGGNGNQTFSGYFTDTSSNVATLVKTGTGSWTLSGQSTLIGQNGYGGNSYGLAVPATGWVGTIGTYTGAISAILWNGTLAAGASSVGSPGSVTSGPFGAGALMICGDYGGSTTGGVTLTSNSTNGYTIANPLLLLGGTASGSAGATGAITLGDSSNDGLTLSGAATLAGFVGAGGSNSFVPIAMTLNVPGNGMTISGAIGEGSGAAGSSIIKSGAGALTLSSAGSTYSGGTTLSTGTLRLGANSTGTPPTQGPIGTGTLALNGGTLSSDGSTARSIGNAWRVGSGASVAFGDSVGTGAVTLNGAGTLNDSNATIICNAPTTFNNIGQVGAATGSQRPAPAR